MDDLFKFKDRALSLGETQVMGILNVTPDSFSDGGQYNSVAGGLKQAELMVLQGASIIDVGGESTRPGAQSVSEQEELDRVIPVIEALAKNVDAVISVDTSTASVMEQAAKSGCHFINDVRALSREGAREAAAKTELPVCLMHMKGQPSNMQENPQYVDVLEEVNGFFDREIELCLQAGIPRRNLLIDPGFGFGKSLQHNLRLLNNLTELKIHGLPMLVGLSRKSMIGTVLKQEVEGRLFGSLASAAVAIDRGSWILRVHDVVQTVDVARMLDAINNEAIRKAGQEGES